ncbi:MAG: hypothetical protein H7327_11510 [Herminiimonas sp.]|nr:hypothetical protein [Herminiimonas sp.]
MQINRKTRNIVKYLGHLKPAETYFVGLPIDAEVEAGLKIHGVGLPLMPGHRVLVSAKAGPASRRNADGFDIVHRDQAKETACRQVVWHWTQFRGRHETEEMSKLVDVPYQRYPRTRIPAYSVELEVKIRADGKAFVVTGPFTNISDQMLVATNTANMLRESLGGFEVLNDDLASWVTAPIRRVNWQLLHPGENPWKSAGPAIEALISRAPVGNQGVLRARLTAVGEKNPDFVAIGLGGFEGYTAFGFKNFALCVLESPQVNNATYILALESWEDISQLTKAQILDAKAHQVRLIHNRSWFVALDAALTARRKAA